MHSTFNDYMSTPSGVRHPAQIPQLDTP